MARDVASGEVGARTVSTVLNVGIHTNNRANTTCIVSSAAATALQDKGEVATLNHDELENHCVNGSHCGFGFYCAHVNCDCDYDCVGAEEAIGCGCDGHVRLIGVMMTHVVAKLELQALPHHH